MEISSKYRPGTIQRGESRGKKVHSSRKRMCADFLTFHFDEIPAYEINTITARCVDIDLPVLEKQVNDFLHIYGREVGFTHTGNNCRDIITLNNLLKDNLPEIQGIELVIPSSDMEEAKQEFVAYKEISNEDFPIMTMFFLPIKIVECVDKRLRDILLDFFTFLEWKSPFLSPKDSIDMCYSIGCQDNDDEFDEYFKEDLDEEYVKEAERYVRGDINAVFEEIKRNRNSFYGDYTALCQRLEIKIKEYLSNGRKWYKTPFAKRKQTKELFEVIQNGIALTLEDSLFNYELKFLRYKFYDETFYEYAETDEIMDFDRQFIFSWGLKDDYITEYLIDMVNADTNISSTVLLNVARIAECTSPVKFSDYPKRWYNWYTKLLNCIYE